MFPNKKKMFCSFYENRLLIKAMIQHKLVYYHTKNILPKQVRKVFMPNPNREKIVKKKSPPNTPPSFEEVIREDRVNKLNIQMLSRSLYKQIFKNTTLDNCSPEILEQCAKDLEKYNMHTKTEDYLNDVNFKIPELLGKNIEEHFQIIGEQQVKPYNDIIMKLLTNIPEPPKTWLMQPGWTRYAPNSEPQKVAYPLEDAVVFDIEVCMMAGKTPTLATAVSDQAWYGWVSESLINCTSKPTNLPHYSLNDLIPLESDQNDDGLILNEHMKRAKVVVGHNVSYDRARIKEQYWLNRTGTRFVDTMSLHICVSGLTSYQRAVLKSGKDNDENESWKQCSSLNSLSEVYKLYCDEKLSKETRNIFVEGTLSDIKQNFSKVMKYCCGDVLATYKVLKVLFPLFLERFPHPVTFAGMLELSTAYLPINNNWNRYINDSEQTYEDLEIESRILLAKRADQACQLLHDNKFEEDLWMWGEDWGIKNIKLKKTITKKIKTAAKGEKEEEEEEKQNKTTTVKKQVKKSQGGHDNVDDLDIDEQEIYFQKKFAYLWQTRDYLSSISTLLPGYPNWYRKLCTKFDSQLNWIPGPHLISTSMQITPKLLSLTWEGYPLHYIREKGWGFIIPFNDNLDIKRKLPLKQLLEKYPLKIDKPDKSTGQEILTKITQIVEENLVRKEFYSKLKKDQTDGLYKGTGIWCNITIEDCCWFFKLPHKNGIAYNVGNPLARDFLNKFSDNVLAGDTENAEHVLAIARMLSYWRNNRVRIKDQMVVWFDNKQLPKHLHDDNNNNVYGAIIPQVIVCGTLTRRAVEPTWMTASNAHPERIGSELRAMIQAPPGYNIIGADVDSQELWIASVIGDASHGKMHGCTPLGWMTLSGNKSNGTDMHSITAKAVGISRDHAKIINYARIYGAGQNFAERLLKQFNPSISDGEAKSKALKMFLLTKGKRIFYLKKEFLFDFPDQAYSKWQTLEMAKACGKVVDEMFHKPLWIDGTESAMFNRLEAIANSPEPHTPFLNGRLTRALETKDDKYLPTRVNWVVQSGAVDFLHLMLVSMRWILNDKIRFCLSFHDEIRYLVPEEYKYQAALAMHLTNLLTRSFCSFKLGIYDLPQSVAFFSSVEIDTVLRKDAKLDCKTPSNPHGLEKGYNIPNGESLDIYEAIKKASGKFSCWYNPKK